MCARRRRDENIANVGIGFAKGALIAQHDIIALSALNGLREAHEVLFE